LVRSSEELNSKAHFWSSAVTNALLGCDIVAFVIVTLTNVLSVGIFSTWIACRFNLLNRDTVCGWHR
jgi:hypothetical protein